ncbi:THO complex subunit 5A-like isoform X2 [Aristolochia californica]|uniref:THO complex subunit 5A-like isoform X2 n=1 Tax=Aristolochia californica TaxID=171875 RepID=UPI0035D88BBE
MEVEEGEAVLLPEPQVEKKVYDMLEETRTVMEEIVAKMLFIKKEGKSKSELKELFTQMSLLFVNLRQVNRSILIEEDHVKSGTENAKAPVDFTTLQLHNLMYEKNHYLKAIKACKDFKSKHPDIELVSEEEFFTCAPEEIKGNMLSKDNAHDLMLKRLNFELYQRKELCKLHEELEKRKKGLLETITNRKKFLSSLPSHLKSLKKASMPVQQQLGIQHSKKLKQHNSAELLPPPLYIIYSQFLAQKEAFEEKINLEIVGNIKDAQTFARQQANKETGVNANTENAKLEEEVPDEEDDGQRRRKRPKKLAGKENLPHMGIYQSHPLNIILHVYDNEGSDPNKPAKLVTVRFEYLLKLNVVCVGIEGSQDGPESSILCNLFPDDTGVGLPHQMGKLLAGDIVSFDQKRILRPYKWAQHLAGIDFLPEVSPLLMGLEGENCETHKVASVLSGLSLYRRQNRIQTVLQKIRSRKKAQMALAEQLESLAKLKWPTLSYENVPWASHTPLCTIQSWVAGGTDLSQVSSISAVPSEQVPETKDTEMDGPSENVQEDGELPTVSQAPIVLNVNKPSPLSKGPSLEHSRRLALISKSVVPSTPGKSSLSYKKNEDLDIILDGESDIDDVSYPEEMENDASLGIFEIANKSWEEYAVREFRLVLSRKLEGNGRNLNLEVKIKISAEYPLRPPLFSLRLPTELLGDDSSDVMGGLLSSSTNELLAMEAEVNLHMLQMLSPDHENQVLAHQIRCLAMLFDFLVDGNLSFCELTKSNSVIDVGLCKPVSGSILARSFRGRDRRRMISWKEMECTTSYPY